VNALVSSSSNLLGKELGCVVDDFLTYPDQDPLALEVNIGDGELVGERHGCNVSALMMNGLTVSQEPDCLA
jgi:hypothetical protein